MFSDFLNHFSSCLLMRCDQSSPCDKKCMRILNNSILKIMDVTAQHKYMSTKLNKCIAILTCWPAGSCLWRWRCCTTCPSQLSRRPPPQAAPPPPVQCQPGGTESAPVPQKFAKNFRQDCDSTKPNGCFSLGSLEVSQQSHLHLHDLVKSLDDEVLEDLGIGLAVGAGACQPLPGLGQQGLNVLLLGLQDLESGLVQQVRRLAAPTDISRYWSFYNLLTLVFTTLPTFCFFTWSFQILFYIS